MTDGVSISRLSGRASQVIREVTETGKVTFVTGRGQPVAVIAPVDPDGADDFPGMPLTANNGFAPVLTSIRRWNPPASLSSNDFLAPLPFGTWKKGRSMHHSDGERTRLKKSEPGSRRPSHSTNEAGRPCQPEWSSARQ